LHDLPPVFEYCPFASRNADDAYHPALLMVRNMAVEHPTRKASTKHNVRRRFRIIATPRETSAADENCSSLPLGAGFTRGGRAWDESRHDQPAKHWN
jgi:hypothetical protein